MMRIHFPLVVLCISACTGLANAAVLDEEQVGDFADDRLNPTRFSLSAGTHLLHGHYGRAQTGGLDLDYLRVDLPAAHALTGLLVLPGTTHGGGRSFIGVQAGTQFTVAPAEAEPSDLLGYMHFSASASPLQILADLGDTDGEAFGAQGFLPPLRGPSYTFWIQEQQAGAVFDYHFEFQVSPVPLPGGGWLLASALLPLANRRRRARKAHGQISDGLSGV